MVSGIGGQLIDILNIYTDPTATDFDESNTQGPNTAVVPRSFLHDSTEVQNQETCPNSDPSVVHPSEPNSQGQNTTLRPLQTYVILIVQNKHLSQARRLKPNMNLYNIRNQGKTTTLQRLKSTILLLKFFHKTNLVILEAVTSICALILTLISQKYTEFDVCKNLFSGPSMCNLHS